VLAGVPVRVRLDGVICRVRILPADFTGWAVCRLVGPSLAHVVRAALLADRQGYLDAWPMVRLRLARRTGPRWLATPIHAPSPSASLGPLVPVHLVEEGKRFDGVIARHDGEHCWFDQVDERSDAELAAFLRESLRRHTPPECLHRRGLTPEARMAYTLAFAAGR
jgi:hypothetical protein